MTAREPIAVIGIGAEGAAGLSAEARGHIDRAGILAGGRRHLEYFPEWSGEKLILEGEIGRFLARLREAAARTRTVVLASGDPLFFGIGRALLEVFPREQLLFLPHLSSVQTAFARIKQPWDDATIVSLHGRPPLALLEALRRGAAKVAVLTDGRNHPAAIAGLLRQEGVGDRYDCWVCENLGGADELLRHWPAGAAPEGEFAPLNVMILIRTEPAAASPDRLPLLGIPETALHHRAGQRSLITKKEVRLISLCQLELPSEGELWDVGAGSGSVSLEAARLAPRLQIHAIEREPEMCRLLRQNLEAFRLPNIHIVEGEAPEILAGLPSPDAVFVGGSGGRLPELLASVFARLAPGGRVVVNCITLQTLGRSWEMLERLGLRPEVTSVQIARSRPLGTLDCLEPENPIFIVRARKP